jgi:hypothetical protein
MPISQAPAERTEADGQTLMALSNRAATGE